MTAKNCYVARSPDVAARMLGDEMMIMSAKNSALFTLNETGASLWNAADGITPLHELVERRICAEFAVDTAEALRDAEELVAVLAEYGLITLSDAPAGANA